MCQYFYTFKIPRECAGGGEGLVLLAFANPSRAGEAKAEGMGERTGEDKEKKRISELEHTICLLTWKSLNDIGGIEEYWMTESSFPRVTASLRTRSP